MRSKAMTAMRGCARRRRAGGVSPIRAWRRQYRLNAGVIVEDPMVEIRLQSQGQAGGRGRAQAGPAGGIFHRAAVAGRHLRLCRRGAALRRPARDRRPMSPAPTTTEAEIPSLQWRQVSAFHLPRPAGARDGVAIRKTWAQAAASRCRNGCASRNGAASFRKPGQLLVETFPRGSRHYLVCYPFEGRLAHQTLGMLLTRRLERAAHAAAGLCRQ